MNQKIISAYMSKLGKKGGRTKGLVKLRGDADYYQRIGRLGVEAKRANAERRAKGRSKANGR